MPHRPPDPAPVPDPATGGAKPATPGPEDPPGIAASILPQRKRDEARHPRSQAQPPKSLKRLDGLAAAEDAAGETGRADSDN